MTEPYRGLDKLPAGFLALWGALPTVLSPFPVGKEPRFHEVTLLSSEDSGSPARATGLSAEARIKQGDVCLSGRVFALGGLRAALVPSPHPASVPVCVFG